MNIERLALEAGLWIPIGESVEKKDMLGKLGAFARLVVKESSKKKKPKYLDIEEDQALELLGKNGADGAILICELYIHRYVNEKGKAEVFDFLVANAKDGLIIESILDNIIRQTDFLFKNPFCLKGRAELHMSQTKSGSEEYFLISDEGLGRDIAKRYTLFRPGD